MHLHTFMLALNLLSPPQVSEALAARLLPVLPLSQCAARLHLRVFYSARGLNTVCILSTFTNNTTMTSPHPKCTRDANKSYFENALIQYLVRSKDGRTIAAMGICSYREKKTNNEPSEEEDFFQSSQRTDSCTFVPPFTHLFHQSGIYLLGPGYSCCLFLVVVDTVFKAVSHNVTLIQLLGLLLQ